MKKFIHWLLDLKSWRAVYPDGKQSVRMRWNEACNYSIIFGGKPKFDPIRWNSK